MQQPACLQIASTAAYSVKTTCVREASLEKEKKEEEEESVFSKHVSSKQAEFGMAALYYNPVICE